VGARARADVVVSCRPELVADAVRDRLEAVDRHPVHVAVTGPPTAGQHAAGAAPRRRAKDGRRVNACVVVRGDGSSLPACLASLGDVADATTVVEAGPDDELASVRNAALDGISGGWVLMVDSTQTLDPASGEVVRDLVYRGGFVGYTARERRQLGLDGAVSAVEPRVAVLFPRHPDLRYVGRIAEQLLPRRADLAFRLVSSPIVLHQHERRAEHDPVGWARRNLPVLERAVREDAGEPFHLYNLGHALELLGLHGEAEDAQRRAIAAATRHATWLPVAQVSLARAIGAQGRKPEAVKACKSATKLAPEWAAGWCALGAALDEAGRPEKALRAYTRALECADDVMLTAGGPDDTAWQVRAAIGKIHFALGHHGEAAECLEGAVALRPTDAELRVWLARAYQAIGWASDARRHLEEAMAGRAGPEAYLRFSEHFTTTAHNALLRGLADNPEDRALLERIDSLRATQAMW
jgi:tetratricopeptide (TPR) repeat protein